MRKGLSGVLLVLGAVSLAWPQNTRSIWDGVYTAQQAKRGATVYAANCARCHGNVLDGDEAPSLLGQEFLRNWQGYTLADLFTRVKDAMPGDEPGVLTSEETAEVIALVLDRNQIPAGKTAMPVSRLTLRQIRMNK